jgi:hypothetical protein
LVSTAQAKANKASATSPILKRLPLAFLTTAKPLLPLERANFARRRMVLFLMAPNPYIGRTTAAMCFGIADAALAAAPDETFC